MSTKQYIAKKLCKGNPENDGLIFGFQDVLYFILKWVEILGSI